MRSFSCFKPRDPFKIRSKELDKRVAIWARNFDSSFKLLLLGPAGAGKTTILKQMKIIHFEGFSLEERQQKAKEIRANLLESVRELTDCITASGNQINWSDKENQNRLEFINGLMLDDQTYDLYAAKIYDYSKRILTDEGVEELFAKLNQLSITHRSQYLLHRVDEIRNANYIPNNDDILQSRRKTSDIQKLEFQVRLPVKSNNASIQQTFCMFDVGGQRGERRKWIQVFDGVSAVMFLIDSSSFDAIDDENGRNKLRETINLFHEVWTSRFLLNSNFVLLFNKQDILREKIERGHRIEDHFPEFKLYKFQPTGERRHGSSSGGSSSSSASTNNRSEKLNLFRSTSSRSTRSSSARSKLTSFDAADCYSASPNTKAPAPAAASPFRDKAAPQSPTPSSKRKSSSLYLFGSGGAGGGGGKSDMSLGSTRGRDGPGSETSNTTLKWPLGDQFEQSRQNKEPMSPASTTRSLPHHQRQTTHNQQQQQPPQRITKPRPSEFHEALQSEPNVCYSSASENQEQEREREREKQRQKDRIRAGAGRSTEELERAIANRAAYLKARSFIRDKFLQVTRQVHSDHEQRKFSSPNLPLYNVASGGTLRCGSARATSAGIDCPKRSVCYHYTTATDTENIRDLFENLQKMVLKSTIGDLI